MATQSYLLDVDANNNPLQGTGGASVSVSPVGSTKTLTMTAISLSTSGSFTLTPTSGSALRVTKLVFTTPVTSTFTFQFGSTAKSGAMTLAANTPFVFNGDDWPIKPAVDQTFVINLSSGSLFGFAINYQE